MIQSLNAKKTHGKQIIGYLTQYDVWKDVPGVVNKGGYNQLNVDFSKYTILNFSFFGLAQDGTLHSADYRNKAIHERDAVQLPSPIINDDIYSSWDRYILFGGQLVVHYIQDNSHAYRQGYRNAEDGGWTNIHTNKSGDYPLVINDPDGPPGLLEKAQKYGVKVMASLGGWSMSKHFPAVAKDPVKRQRLVAACRVLIDMGFDGIDLDWEFPGGHGMNIFDASPDDYRNFTILVDEIRSEIGDAHLITAAFSTAIKLLSGFEWDKLQKSMNYFNIMTYDVNGGWSDIAGHNSPLYNYPGQEGGDEASSLDKTIQYLLDKGVASNKINAGIAFYGRGVITDGRAKLNATTIKVNENIPPDGPIATCSDFDNWPKNIWDGTPNFAMIDHLTGEGKRNGWVYHWDDQAKVPYLTKDKYFLSYDNVQSVAEKASYVVKNDLAGVIIWTSFGDLQNLTDKTTVHQRKLVESHGVISRLVSTLVQVFDERGEDEITLTITSPLQGAEFSVGASISLAATVRPDNKRVARAFFKVGDKEYPAAGDQEAGGTIPTYHADISASSEGQYGVQFVVEDDNGNAQSSPVVDFSITPFILKPPVLNIVKSSSNGVQLSWRIDGSHNGFRFRIFRNNRCIASDISEYQFTDKNVEVARTYQYYVLSEDTEGNVSGASNKVTATIVDRGDRPDIKGKKIIIGFWLNERSPGYRGGRAALVRPRDAPLGYNVIAVAFMKAGADDHIPDFTPPMGTEGEFREEVAALHGQGRAVLLSLGGADAHIELSSSDENAFVTRIITLVDRYGFDGIDIDLEQTAIAAKDNQTVIPNALKRVKDHYRAQGWNFIISMAPEFPYLRSSGKYVPYINALEDYYDLIAPQYYNQGGDGVYVPGLGWLGQTNDAQKTEFLFHLTKSLLTGTNDFIRLPSDKFAIGLPANNDAAATGYVIDPESVLEALQRLDKDGLSIRGLMTWSINWDAGHDKDGVLYNWEFIERYGGLIEQGHIEVVRPSAPTSLKVLQTTSSSVELSWQPSTGPSPIRNYTLFRDEVPVVVSAPPYTDTGRMAGQEYEYRVQATDQRGITSELSESVTARTSRSEEKDPESWDPGLWYPDDTLVVYQKWSYRCVMQHTSNPFWPPDKATSLWQSQNKIS